MNQIEEEIEKNKAIYEVNQAMASGYDANSKKLDLAGKTLKNLRFLPKMVKENINSIEEIKKVEENNQEEKVETNGTEDGFTKTDEDLLKDIQVRLSIDI